MSEIESSRSTSEHAHRGPQHIRVSVVVPVFQPGPSFDDLIASLDRQSLASTAFEVLLCDDGSGEPTASRLAEVARTRPFVRVLSLPHSGWPGTPRNCGVDEARGTYVQFVDQDDYLFDGALEALCDYADEHGSDVVVGREVGIGRELPSRIFRRDIPRAALGEDPLLEMLTPHKLFRTAFLRENRIRFPEGRVRLEDHLFVMQAYFAASTISILASEPCYAWVKHPGSASSSRIDPETYFPHLETVLDVVEAHTEPGPLRDRLLRHWFRGKILKRLAGKRMRKYPAEYRARLLDVVVPLVQRRFGPGVDAGLAFPHRIRAALLRADRRDDLLRFAEFEAGMECRATVTKARWSRGGGLYLTVRVRIVVDGADALVFRQTSAGGLELVSLPSGMAEGLPEKLLVAGRELRNDRLELTLREPTLRDGGAVSRRLTRAPLTSTRDVALSIDPVKVFSRDDASGGGAIIATVRRAGWTFEVPLDADPEVLARAGRSPFLAGHPCTLAATADGTVELHREWPGGRLNDFAARATRRIRSLARRS
ncbi:MULTISPECIES: glycosyltransferase family A protein [unclassified Microbacterium]|uniref:glycosyltransferase family A protein n=1 Tax=unclassified Microbacterium TaxID=2609290 RepID=UPI0030191B19